MFKLNETRLEEERKLIERAKRDPEAFGILYERYVDRIYSYIFYKVGNQADAEDLTAKTFLKALKHIENYEYRGVSFYAWLHRIAHNVVANWVRARTRRKTIPVPEIFPFVGSSDEPEPIEVLAEEERRRELLELVRSLPPMHQELLYLKFVERLTNREIGEIMGKSESAIKSLYHRTLVMLRAQLRQKESAG